MEFKTVIQTIGHLPYEEACYRRCPSFDNRSLHYVLSTSQEYQGFLLLQQDAQLSCECIALKILIHWI